MPPWLEFEEKMGFLLKRACSLIELWFTKIFLLGTYCLGDGLFFIDPELIVAFVMKFYNKSVFLDLRKISVAYFTGC
jgi:hypothetical protein